MFAPSRLSSGICQQRPATRNGLRTVFWLFRIIDASKQLDLRTFAQDHAIFVRRTIGE